MFADVIQAYVTASQHYVGEEASQWDTQGHLFMWLIFNLERLVLGPQPNKESEKINECVARRLQLLRAGHVKSLWEESCRVQSRQPQQSRPPDPSRPDKTVQDAADKDNWKTAHARAVKPQTIAPITPRNRPIAASKYPRRTCRGRQKAPEALAEQERANGCSM